MKPNHIKKTLLAACAIAAALLCSCAGGPAEDPGDTGTGAAVTTASFYDGKLIFSENGKTQYRIIFPSKPADPEFSAYAKISEAFAGAGVKIGFDRDSSEAGGYEIIIGSSDRDASRKYTGMLRKDDFVIAVEGSSLVIAGGSPSKTLEAAELFLSGHLKNENGCLFVDSGLSVVNTGEYRIKSATLNGIGLAEYKIVIPAKPTKLQSYAASLLCETIAEKTGIALETVKTNDNAEKGIVLMPPDAGMTPGSSAYGTYFDGKNAYIVGTEHTLTQGVLAFIGMIEPDEESNVKIVFPESFTETSVKKAAYPAENTIKCAHPLALCDQKNNCLTVIDPDAADPASKDAEIWSWKPTSALGYSISLGNRIDEAIFRYSVFHGSYVFCVTSSAGAMALVEYPSGKCLWEGSAGSLGPHSIELLPDGNVAVVCSGNSDTSQGCIRIYLSSKGKKTTQFISDKCESAHGVVWDDENELLWVLGAKELRAYRIGGTSDSPELIKIQSLCSQTPISGCHNLSVWAKDPDYLIISGASAVLYRKSTGNYITNFEGSDAVSVKNVKCIDCFNDGVIVYNVATDVYKSHDTDTLYIVTPSPGGTSEVKKITLGDKAFYKARRVSADYS